MSLINQMLQDLETRHASGAERGVLPNQVRVLPRTEKSGTPWWLLGSAVAVALLAALAWQLKNQPVVAPPAPVAKIAPAPPPALAETPPLLGLASRLTLDLEHVPAADTGKPAGRPGAEGIVTMADLEPSPQPQTKPSKAAEKAPKMAPAAKPPVATASVIAAEPAVPVKPVAAVPKAEPAKAAPTAVEVAKPDSPAPPALTAATVTTATAKPATSAAKPVESAAKKNAPAILASVQIDKRSHQLTPRQLAENEYRNAANLLNQDRRAEAQEGFRLALQHDPGHTGARQGLFGLLLEAKKKGEAEQVLRDGLDLSLSQPGFAMALARLQVDRGDSVGAVETMQRSASAALGSPDYLAFHAALLQRQSRHQEAVDHYLAALRLAPGSGVWLMGLGISLHALNRNREAQDAFLRAKVTNTLNPELQAFVEQRLRQLQ
jgi:MSHA biogenesis protein MshN